MAAGAITLPEGFKLDEAPAPSATVALPQGFKLDAPQAAPESQIPNAINYDPAIGNAEAALSLGSGMIAAPLGGILGAGRAMFPGKPGSGADLSARVSDALTYRPRTASGQMQSGIVAAPFELLAKGADAAGGAVTDATGSPAAGAAVNTGLQAIPMAIGKVLPKVGSAIKPKGNAAVDAGFKVTPQEAGAGGIQNNLASVAGEPRLARKISRANETMVHDKIASDLGLEKDVPITREVLEQIREKNGGAYETLRKAGNVEIDQQFMSDLGQIAKDRQGAAKDFPRGKDPVMDVYQRLTRNEDGSVKRSFDANSGVSEIKNLREDAKSAFAEGKNNVGKANLEAAQALESALDRHMQKQPGGGEAMAEFKKARQQIAKTYDAEKALVADGEINPQAYAKLLEKGKPLSGGALEVAQAAKAAPRSLMKPSGQATGATLSDLGMMFVKGIGRDMTMADPALLFARPAIRSAIASEPYQNAFIRGGLANGLSSPAMTHGMNLGAYSGLAGAPRPFQSQGNIAESAPGTEYNPPPRGMPMNRLGGGSR